MKGKASVSKAGRNRKYQSPEARGSRASKGNWNKARWLVLWQSAMNCHHMDWSSGALEQAHTNFWDLTPYTSSQFHVLWLEIGQVYLRHKNQPTLFFSSESQFSSTLMNWIMWCCAQIQNPSFPGGSWSENWSNEEIMSWEREGDRDFQWLSYLTQQEQTN